MQEESQPLTYGHLASGQDPGEDLTNSDNNEAHVEKQSGNDYSSEGKSGHSHGFVNEQLKSYDTTGDQQHNASADQENKTSSENIINKIFKADSSKLFHQESYTEQIVNNDEEGKEQRDNHHDINEDKNERSKKGKCKDLIPNCHDNKKACYNPNSMEIMRKTCKKTCGFCHEIS